MKEEFNEEVKRHFSDIVLDMRLKYPTELIEKYLQGYSQCLWELDLLNPIQYKDLMKFVDYLVTNQYMEEQI